MVQKHSAMPVFWRFDISCIILICTEVCSRMLNLKLSNHKGTLLLGAFVQTLDTSQLLPEPPWIRSIVLYQCFGALFSALPFLSLGTFVLQEPVFLGCRNLAESLSLLKKKKSHKKENCAALWAYMNKSSMYSLGVFRKGQKLEFELVC